MKRKKGKNSRLTARTAHLFSFSPFNPLPKLMSDKAMALGIVSAENSGFSF
jgi:hypothetical protein